jgi:hypothetical protein
MGLAMTRMFGDRERPSLVSARSSSQFCEESVTKGENEDLPPNQIYQILRLKLSAATSAACAGTQFGPHRMTATAHASGA